MTEKEFNEKRTKIQKEREAILKMLDDISSGFRKDANLYGTESSFVTEQLRWTLLHLVKKEIDLIQSCDNKDIFDLYFKKIE